MEVDPVDPVDEIDVNMDDDVPPPAMGGEWQGPGPTPDPEENPYVRSRAVH